MKETVLIQIRSRQTAGNETETIENTYYGKYHAFPDMHSILYEEFAPGEEGNPNALTKNIMKIKADSLLLKRKGLIETEMFFQVGVTSHGFYQTPYGSFDMTIHTGQLDISCGPEQIDLSFSYALELGGQHVSDCHMEIQIRNCQKIT